MNVSQMLKGYRNRVAFVIFLAFIPFFAFDSYQSWRECQNTKEQYIQETVRYMDAIVKRYEDALFSARKELALLSKIPAIRETRTPECQEVLQGFRALSSFYVNLGVMGSKGEVLCVITPLHYMYQELFALKKRVQVERHFVVGDVILSPFYEYPILLFALPILGTKGEESGILMGGGKLDWFSDTNLRQHLGTHAKIYLIDSRHKIVDAYPQNADIIGHKVDEQVQLKELTKRTSSRGIWWEEGYSLDGKLLALSLGNPRGIRLLALLNPNEICAKADSLLLQSLIYLGVMILIAYLLPAFMIKELVLKEVHSLFKVAIAQSKYTATSELLNSIAHQWRQPLNGLNIQLSLLKDSILSKNPNIEESHTLLDMMERSIQSLSQGISRISGFFKRDKVKEKFMLHSAIKEAFSFLESSLNEGKITYEILGEDVEMVQFRKELIRNLLSLFQNSVDAFALLHENQEIRKIEIETSALKNSALMIIRDNAGGINEEMIEKIFQPYTTTKFQGDGVGLSLFIVKNIIEQEMHGNIQVRNIEGGAEFVIELPIF
ncbi:MAG: sensor histidine kinase [Wolinella sp.]